MYLITSDICWELFSGKKNIFLPTHQQESRKNTGNDDIFFFALENYTFTVAGPFRKLDKALYRKDSAPKYVREI